MGASASPSAYQRPKLSDGTLVTFAPSVEPPVHPTRLTHLDDLPLFAELSATTRARLAAGSAVRSFAEGSTLFCAGDAVTGLYIVLSGRVRVVRTRDGRQSVVHTEGPGGTLAEVPMFAGGGLPATAVAIEQTRCLHLPQEVLLAAMRDDPAVAQLFLRRLAMRVRHVVDRLDALSTQSVMGRLAALLVTRAEAASGGPFTLGMTQADAAEELGTVREVLVRGIGTLRREGLIASAGRGRFEVRDLDALRRLAAE